MRGIVASIVVAVALAAWWLTGDLDAPAAAPPSPPAPAVGARPEQGVLAPPDATERTSAGGDVPFVSASRDGGVIAGTARDGVVVLVLGADRTPRANAALTVHWRKGFGLYGSDRGATDAAGRFPTTVSDYEMVEAVALLDPALGELVSHDDFVPQLADPRTILVVVPALQPVAVRLCDERGRAIAGGEVSWQCVRAAAPPREHWLLPEAGECPTDAEGRARLLLPVGAHELDAEAAGHEALYTLTLDVPPGGRSVTMHLLADEVVRDVEVTVQAPADLTAAIEVSAFTERLAPTLPGLEPAGIEPRQRRLRVQQVGPRRFTVAAPAVPWHLAARADGCDWVSVDVAADAGTATLTLQRRPPRAVARLHCRLLLPDGRPTSGQVMVHTAPDFLHGQRHEIDGDRQCVEVAPGGRTCVSGWLAGHAPAVVGPLELTPGDHEVVLQFVPPQALRGRVVDAEGRPVAATVALRRPAGPLRALAADVGEILVDSATGDSRGTGPDGAFAFDHLGVGTHELWVTPAGRGWPARVRVAPGAHDVVVRLGEGLEGFVHLQGRVTLAGTGQPVAGAEVIWSGEHWYGSAITDADGGYMQVARPGRLHVQVRARRCGFLRGEPKQFAAGPATEDVVVAPSEPLFVCVRDAEGRVPAVDLMAFDAHGREIPFQDANGNYDGEVLGLGRAGRVVLRGLPPARLRLRLEREVEAGGAVETQDVDVPAELPRDVEFTIVWQPARK